MPTKWGVIGATSVCQDFIRTLSKLPGDEHKIIGIAAVEDLKAKQLVKQFKIKFFTSTENLAKDNDIDVVFVGCQLPEHYRVVKMMLKYQKHVVCCKPLGMNLQETTAMIARAKENHLLLMEAIGPRYLPSYQFLRDQLKAKIIGEPIQMIATIGFPISTMDHSHYKEFGGGSILDLGIYPLQLMLLSLGVSPYEIIALGSLNEEGVDENMGAVIRYGDGKLAVISTHSKGLLPNEAFIIGTKGIIKLNEPFWNPKTIKIGSSTHSFHTLDDDYYTSIHRHSIGLKYIANEATKYINAGLIESNLITHQESLILANLQDRIRKQIGVFYRSDHDLSKKIAK